jgi:CBS domain-containing protein
VARPAAAGDGVDVGPERGHRIDDVVVIDDDNVPVGIVDSQDLTRLKLL